MPPKRRRDAECKHTSLLYEPSSHASEVGYERPRSTELVAASLVSGSHNGTKSTTLAPLKSTFPAPLVLPGDDLSCDPQAEMQTVRDWRFGKYRNSVTPLRRTIYVVPPPDVSPGISELEGWTHPKNPSKNTNGILPPNAQDVSEYLSAFYNNLPVKLLSGGLRFTKWEDAQSHKYVGLQTKSEIFGVRFRPGQDGTYSHQLNLNHLLDVAITILPHDAYALIMLVNHDLYEDEEDDFCCGRAYGGSRVAVVSTARYHPFLDEKQEVECTHPWPASHCEAFVATHCGETKRKRSVASKRPPTALEVAVAAFRAVKKPETPSALETLWLGRVCKTASHELGHCFGIDHCTYYACVMQGTTGLSEDAGQPPYLCPIDLAKILHATSSTANSRYEALLRFCERKKGDRLFDSFAAWLRVRIPELDEL